jgi:hypothetical protein
MKISPRAETWVVLLIGLFLGGRSTFSAVDKAGRIYAKYDREFRTLAAKANQRVGKEVIKVERLSDQFTVPQKLAIRGMPYEIGLTIGYIGQRAKARLPMLAESNRALNQKVVAVFDQPGPYELLTNTPLQEGEELLLRDCVRYRKAKPLLETGVRNQAEMLAIMKAMRITSGPARTLWTSVTDLNARTFEVRYFKEFDRKYEFKF